MSQQKTLSASAIRLGYAGLIPQAIFLSMAISGDEAKWIALAGGFAYAALIFSFLGGVWWGMAMTADGPQPRLFFIAVAPSLISLACFMPWVWGLPWPGPYLIILGGGLILSPIIDDKFFSSERRSEGWIKLRVRLSLALGAMTLLIGVV